MVNIRGFPQRGIGPPDFRLEFFLATQISHAAQSK